jgi:hypothetical protein
MNDNQYHKEPTQKPKFELHLNSKDFEGVLWRLGELGLAWGVCTYFTQWDGGLIFLILCIFWATYFTYKIAIFKENSYRQIIQDLEDKNQQLRKANQLLQNVLHDKTGMRIKLDE